MMLHIDITKKELWKLRLKHMRYSFLSKIPISVKREYYRGRKKKIEQLLSYYESLIGTQFLSLRDSAPSVAHEEPAPVEPAKRTVKAVAFYLPQYHPFPVNDAAWGKGFTEWTMVRKAAPHFPGHYQPEIPGDLGYYDLRDTEVMRKQTEMARKFGVHGFCFHYYWFDGGKRLMELPLEAFLADRSIDFPFCLNWANENWTKRWDGLDNEIIMGQKYSEENDRVVIRDCMRYFRDPRYIRIDNRPVFFVYRSSQFPDMRGTLDRWREECAREGEEMPLFFMVLHHDCLDPAGQGFDGAVEFAPHPASQYSHIRNLPPPGLDPAFRGQCFPYDELALNNAHMFAPGLPSYPCVCPSWDNTPRKGKEADFFWGSTPEKYAEWITLVGEKLVRHFPEDRRFLFINAWNEWGEGAYLEPDEKHGYAYLNATSRALAAVEEGKWVRR